MAIPSHCAGSLQPVPNVIGQVEISVSGWEIILQLASYLILHTPDVGHLMGVLGFIVPVGPQSRQARKDLDESCIG